MQTDRKPVAIFGGSFDPPHEGHMQVVRELLGSKDYRLIVLAVTMQNPLKKSKATDFDTRLVMLKTVVLAEGFPLADSAEGTGVYISEFPYNYTYEFVENWKSKRQDELVWVIGEDLKDEVKQWRNWNNLNLNLKIMPEYCSMRSTQVRQKEMSPHPALDNFIRDRGLYPE